MLFSYLHAITHFEFDVIDDNPSVLIDYIVRKIRSSQPGSIRHRRHTHLASENSLTMPFSVFCKFLNHLVCWNIVVAVIVVVVVVLLGNIILVNVHAFRVVIIWLFCGLLFAADKLNALVEKVLAKKNQVVLPCCFRTMIGCSLQKAGFSPRHLVGLRLNCQSC